MGDMNEDPRWRVGVTLREVLSEGEGRWGPRTHQHAHLLAQHFGADPGHDWWWSHLDFYEDLHNHLPERLRQRLPEPVRVLSVDDTLVSPFHRIPVMVAPSDEEKARESGPTRKTSGTLRLQGVPQEVQEWRRNHEQGTYRSPQCPPTGTVQMPCANGGATPGQRSDDEDG